MEDIQDVVAANLGADIFIRKLNIILVLDLTVTIEEDLNEIRRKINARIGSYQNTMCLVDVRHQADQAAKSEIENILQKEMKNSAFEVNWNKMFRNIKRKIGTVHHNGTLSEGDNSTFIDTKNYIKFTPLNTDILIFCDSINEQWSKKYNWAFKQANFISKTIIFDNFSHTHSDSIRISNPKYVLFSYSYTPT